MREQAAVVSTRVQSVRISLMAAGGGAAQGTVQMTCTAAERVMKRTCFCMAAFGAALRLINITYV